MVKLFAGGFPRDLEDVELKEIFEQFGVVEAVNIVRDKHTGISRRFGFVDMADAESAARAIANLHEASVDDDTISVIIADDRQKDKEAAKKMAAQKVQIKPKPKTNFKPRSNNNKWNNGGGNSGYTPRNNNRNGGGYGNSYNNSNSNNGGNYNNSSSYNSNNTGDVVYTKVVRPGESSGGQGRRPRKRM